VTELARRILAAFAESYPTSAHYQGGRKLCKAGYEEVLNGRASEGPAVERGSVVASDLAGRQTSVDLSSSGGSTTRVAERLDVRTLPFGTPDDVRREVAENIRILGAGGGYILAPCHNIQAVSPVENVVAMYEAGWELGRDPA
jgi:hypothetical protein